MKTCSVNRKYSEGKKVRWIGSCIGKIQNNISHLMHANLRACTVLWGRGCIGGSLLTAHTDHLSDPANQAIELVQFPVQSVLDRVQLHYKRPVHAVHSLNFGIQSYTERPWGGGGVGLRVRVPNWQSIMDTATPPVFTTPKIRCHCPLKSDCQPLNVLNWNRSLRKGGTT